MHSIVLLTAMTATSGLFGGHRGMRANHQASYSAPSASCRTGTCPQSPYATMAPPVYPRMAAPAPQQVSAPAYTSYYYPPMTSGCASGACPKR